QRDGAQRLQELVHAGVRAGCWFVRARADQRRRQPRAPARRIRAERSEQLAARRPAETISERFADRQMGLGQTEELQALPAQDQRQRRLRARTRDEPLEQGALADASLAADEDHTSRSAARRGPVLVEPRELGVARDERWLRRARALVRRCLGGDLILALPWRRAAEWPERDPGTRQPVASPRHRLDQLEPRLMPLQRL